MGTDPQMEPGTALDEAWASFIQDTADAPHSVLALGAVFRVNRPLIEAAVLLGAARREAGLRTALEHIIECIQPNTTAGAIPERIVDTDARILADHLTDVVTRALSESSR